MIERPPHLARVHPAHILVMDDVPAILDILREIFEEDGHRVTTSQELLNLQQIRALRPDMIVSDLLFPGVQNAVEPFWRAARHDVVLASLPIILCTAASRIVQGEVMAQQLRALRVHVVLKPFDIDGLLALVAESLLATPSASMRGLPQSGSPTVSPLPPFRQ
jgi:CheY-like chemotaxis protein